MKFQLAGFAAGLLVLAACGSSMSPYGGGGGGGGCTPTATTVCMVGFSFNPTNLTVAAGTTVTWRSGSAYTHTVTSDPGSSLTYNSGDVQKGGVFSQTFATAGTYNYHCKYHQVTYGMSGTITVTP